MDARKYVAQPGVYGGYTVLCLRCKGMTYVPESTWESPMIFTYMRDHELWCSALLDQAIAQLLA